MSAQAIRAELDMGKREGNSERSKGRMVECWETKVVR